jgi:hypothetical protein
MGESLRSDYQGHCEAGTHPTPISLRFNPKGLDRGADNPIEMSEIVAMSEVTYHASRFGDLVALLGLSIEIGDNESYFRGKREELAKHAHELIEFDRRMSGVILAARLGQREAMAEDMKWIIERMKAGKNLAKE